MIKKRIIPTLIYKDNGLVKSINYQNYRFIGDPLQAVQVYNLRDVDELLVVDISEHTERPNLGLIKEIVQGALMPLTIGGGIKTIAHIGSLLEVGTDKVCIATSAIENSQFIEEAIAKFGGQSIVIAIDYTYQSGKPKLVTNPGLQVRDIDILSFVQRMSAMDVSEFILTSIDHEGLMQGYDIALIKEIEKFTKTGIIVNGGAGSYEHMQTVFQNTNAVGVGAASMFHFTEQTPKRASHFLKANGINTRI